MKVLCLYFKNTPDLKNIAELFYQLTPQIALRGNEAIFLEMSKGQRLLSEQSFLKRALVILRKFKLAPRYALAEDAGTALAYCKFFTNKKNILPLAALQCYLEPFKMDSDYDGAFAKMTPHLQRLGIKSVQDFLTLSPSSLPSRFGPVGLLLFMRLRNPETLMWPTFTPEEHVVERIDFQEDWRMESMTSLIFHLKSLLDRAQLRLRAQGFQLKEFEVVFHQEKFSTIPDPEYKVRVDLSMTQITAKSLLNLTKEKIDYAIQKKPLRGIIASLELRVLDKVPYRPAQKNLFEPKKEENLESWYELLARLSLRLGKENVFQAQPRESHLPEKTWERALPGDPNPAIQWQAPTRPLRTFPHPQKVDLQGNILRWPPAPGQKNADFFEIEEVSHREVILSEWWNDFIERVYFRAKTKSGEDLWLFRSTEGVFIHGYFD
jgi:protein ImuB